MKRNNFRPLSLVFALFMFSIILPAKAVSQALESVSQFEFAGVNHVTEFYLDSDADPLVKWAVNALLDDIHSITGLRPRLNEVKKTNAQGVFIGQLSDALITDSNLLTKPQQQDLQGKWEHFSFHLYQQNLILLGSDVRGTVYGIFELAERLGISPWQWWADVQVTPQQVLTLQLNDSGKIHGPSVQYRGIFLNDEDWGLRPWAAKTFDPKLGNIGPKTYEKIFQLLLRLKANTLWPAMHPGTAGFFTVPGNPQMAAKYHIVVGSSHAEPMLRNNVAEWDLTAQGDYNYFSNKAKVDAYWQQRINEVKATDTQTMMTLGMRGVHDSGMQGAKSTADAIAILQNIIGNQRDMLSTSLNKKLIDIPQAFIPYKEVLPLYDAGLPIPDDVTLMWTDDNYGYIRRLSDSTEQQRVGGSGVYYHLSYWGRPHDYLWLNTTQPGLIWYEMSRAYANGAKKIWIANVGDIKPAEYNMEFFLDLAWDIDAVKGEQISAHLRQWAAREFTSDVANDVSEIMNEYYRLAMIRKPEYMGWGQTEQTTPNRISEFSDSEAKKRISDYEDLVKRAKELDKKIPYFKQDAWFQLVIYPLKSAALINKKFLYQQLYAHSPIKSKKAKYKYLSIKAYKQIEQLTQYYNQQLAKGKWQNMMSMAPRNLPVFSAPDFKTTQGEAYVEPRIDSQNTYYLQANQISQQFAPQGYQWQVIESLGYSDAALTLSPFSIAKFEQFQAWVEYDLDIKTTGNYVLELRFLPTHTNNFDHQVHVQLDSQLVSLIELSTQGRSEQWKTNVLRNSQIAYIPLNTLSNGPHKLRLSINQTGIVIDQLALYPQQQARTYALPLSE